MLSYFYYLQQTMRLFIYIYSEKVSFLKESGKVDLKKAIKQTVQGM